MVTFGVLCHRNAYLHSGWNLLDFTVVATSILGLALQAATSGGDAAEDLAVFQALRAVRVLRPLRMASRVPGMRVLVHSLGMAIPQLAGVTLLALIVPGAHSVGAVEPVAHDEPAAQVVHSALLCRLRLFE